MTTFFNQSDDIIQTSGNALEFGADDENLTIDTGVLVSSVDGSGVFSAFNQSVLTNNGVIHSAANVVNSDLAGVTFSGGSATLQNNGVIVGQIDGFVGGGNGITIGNVGAILGLEGSGIFFQTTADQISTNNSGDIFGRDRGIFVFSDNDGGTITNSGRITSPGHAIDVNTDPGLVTIIINQAGGVISGSGSDRVVGGDLGVGIHTFGDGAISLTNRGSVTGGILCTADDEDDMIVNLGSITGQVRLGSGDDSFNGAGGRAATVFGEDGTDTLSGGNFADSLNGGAGTDRLTGRGGRDLLTGGTEKDIFDFNTIRESVKGANRDQILDFNRAELDKIDLSSIDADTDGTAGNQKFKFIGTAAFHRVDGELRCKNGIIQGDVNGDGKVDFEIHINLSSLNPGDFFL